MREREREFFVIFLIEQRNQGIMLFIDTLLTIRQTPSLSNGRTCSCGEKLLTCKDEVK